MQDCYGHSHPDHPDDSSKWEPLFAEGCGNLRGDSCDACAVLDPNHGHINKVAYLAGKFAAEMFPAGSNTSVTAAQWGQLAGWWHDLGKFAPEWQEYLKRKVDPHQDDVSGKVDHSTAGAQFAVKAQCRPLGHLLAFGIAGHHSGLLDAESNYTCQKSRLQKTDRPKIEIEALPEAIRKLEIPKPSASAFPFLFEALKRHSSKDAFSVSLFSRMLFSCLVDADFIATEAFMAPKHRNQVPEQALVAIHSLVQQKIGTFGIPQPNDIVNQQRAQVVKDCQRAAPLEPGLFTLTVPTGGGKTLSSLSFALKHALSHAQRRIIYVVPFTSIIEQNAEVIREIVKPLETDSFTPLIEHHSSFDPKKETEQSRLAAENWDAPIIITTAVQFYESLFAARTSRSRKLHNIANSVVILDEAQTFPVDLLQPCLNVLQELAENYHSTIVLCTATQPAISYDSSYFEIGLRGSREIIRDTSSLFDALKRVEVQTVGDLPDADLCKQLESHSQALCIVNRRKHAQELFQKLSASEENFHLSAQMCPEHRSHNLHIVHKRLADRLPIRLISTQLIEAGVDVDFPIVYRALAGLDSIAQAAGRCNRNGKLSELGQTYVFKPEDQKAEAYFHDTAQVAAQVCELHKDLLSEEAIRRYFDLYYYEQKPCWDKHGILDPANLRFQPDKPKLPFAFQYKTIAEKFRMIDNDWQVPVIIPYDERARKLISDLGNESIPLHRTLLRSLQRYTVQISHKVLQEHHTAFEALRDDQFHALICIKTHYSDDFGLILDETYTANQNLVC